MIVKMNQTFHFSFRLMNFLFYFPHYPCNGLMENFSSEIKDTLFVAIQQNLKFIIKLAFLHHCSSKYLN